MKTERPSFFAMNDAVTYISRYMYQAGNSQLLNERVRDLTLNVSYKWITLTASYEHLTTPITQWNYLTETEAMLCKHINLDKPINTISAYTRYSSIEEGTQLSRSDMPRATDTEHQRVILEPDALWMATSSEFTLTEADTEPGAEATTITMQPTTRVREITITIHNVPNLQYTGQFGGALSGLAGSVWAESGESGDELVIQAFPVTVLDETTLQMHFRTFGHCPHADEGDTNTHLLTIYAILADGNKWYYTEDVTEQIHGSSSSTEEEIYVELDGLPLPKPIVNGSGFQPTVDGWQSEEIDVDM